VTDQQPFDWWFSGRYWYCSLQASPSNKVSGCGVTKQDAIVDAQREALKYQGRVRRQAAYKAAHTVRSAQTVSGKPE
jgi:sRNA-binding protein